MTKLAVLPVAVGALIALAVPAHASPVTPAATVWCNYKVPAGATAYVHSKATHASSVIDSAPAGTNVTARKSTSTDPATGYVYRYGTPVGHKTGWIATDRLTGGSVCFTE